MQEPTILVVDDDQDILDLLEYHLTKEGYDVITLDNTKLMRDILDEEDISLIIMDRNLPQIEGSEYIKKLAKEGYSYPVIYLSAKDSNEDIIQGFERYGDDYITKPFDINILKARVKALLKRVKGDFEVKKVGDITYDAKLKQFYINNEPIKLTKLEHNLLLELFNNPNTLLDRYDLIDSVWGGEDVGLKTLTVAIKRLREKIDPNNEKKYIEAVRGEGYIFRVK